jgi:hypothetical protein
MKQYLKRLKFTAVFSLSVLLSVVIGFVIHFFAPYFMTLDALISGSKYMVAIYLWMIAVFPLFPIDMD